MRRRAVFACLAAAGLAAAIPHGYATTGSASPRLVVLDWSLTELLLSAGIAPVGISNSAGFRLAYTACDLPRTVVDLGLMFQPNLELLLALKPDLIIVTPAHMAMKASLERIAPTATFGQFRSSPTPYSSAMKETLALGRLCGREHAAMDVIAAADAALKQAGASIAAMPGIRERPLYIARFIDENYLRVYGAHSFYGELLGLLGLENAWRDRTGTSAFSTRRLEDLDAPPVSTLVYFRPLAAAAASMMKTSPLWHAMPFAKPGGMLGLPLFPLDGGVLSATYFARTLTHALADGLPGTHAAVSSSRRCA
jgi:ABC-type Fe3+-hydroxamate transport system substrate-binding protein